MFLIGLYTMYVRPILEYNSQIWNPSLRKDILLVESIQRKFLRCLPGFATMTYTERLSASGLDSLEYRRLRHDLLLVYKLLRHDLEINTTDILDLDTVNLTRGHSKKLKRRRYLTSLGQSSFSYRVVRIWNDLPEFVVSSRSPKHFMRNLDSVKPRIRKFLKEF